MTIAMGYRCLNGVVVAADTLVIIGIDAQEGTKVDARWTTHGRFAFVNASDDGNATATLTEDIFHAIENSQTLGTYQELGKVIKATMTSWRQGFGGRKPPATQLILGAQLGNLRARLYACDPPNTFLEKDDYWAVGSGAAVTDPLYQTLFGMDGGEYTDVQGILRRISYLFYRAKKDNVYCGKNTECAIVSLSPPPTDGPIAVEPHDMKQAELYMREVDNLLSSAALFATASGAFNAATVDQDALELADMLRTLDDVRTLTFHDHRGDVIKLSVDRI
jgi:hypothetical protein